MAGVLLPGPTASTPVLELRVHGVNDTRPDRILQVPSDAAVEAAGDKLGGFWVPTTEGQSGLRAGDPGRVPVGIRREAYSWGGLARSSPAVPAGPAIVGRVAGILGRLGWTLLIPLSMANMAYWTRRPRARADGSVEPGPGAGLIRLLGLLQTLLLTATSAVVALDLFGTQCFAGGRQVCSSVPTQLDVLADLTEDRRLALLSLVPLLLLVFLAVLTARSRVRYPDARGHGGTAEADAAAATPTWPLLSSAGFWNAGEVLGTTARLHVSGAATLVAGITAGQGAAVVGGPSVGGLRGWLELSLVIVAGVVGLGAAVTVVRTADDAPDLPPGGDPAWPRIAVPVLAGLCLATQEGLLVFWPRTSDGHPLRGLGVVTAILVAALLAAGLAALSLRRLDARGGVPRGWWRYGPPAFALAAVVVATVHVWPGGHSWPRIVATVLAPLAALVAAAYGWRGGYQPRAYEAWRGQGPGVFALIGAYLAMLLSSALVLAVGDVLNGSLSASTLTPGSTCHGAGTTGRGACPSTARHLFVPGTYLSFASTVLPVVLGLVATVGLAWWYTRRLTPDDPGPVGGARRFAAVAQRAEIYVGVLAALAGAALAVAVAAGVLGHDLDRLHAPIDALTSVGVWLLLLVGGGVVTLVSGGGGKRPFGLVWDLVCVLPRTAHPFGPPCYAERAVPELGARVEAWAAPRRGRVVLSAHSLGAVLAVAVVMRLGAARERVSLLTYGVQLRPYFGRMFPELLGPEVVGGSSCRAPRLRTADPWAAESRDRGRLAHPLAPLRVRLGGSHDLRTEPRWRSLWHETDYLGFPAIGYFPNVVDRLAAEVDTTRYLPTVLTHGDYPRTPEYAAELELLSRP